VQGYCYQFWRCRNNAFRGDGAFGQFTVMMPEQDAVVVMTGESNNLQGELDLVWEHLLPAMKPGPLPADAGAVRELRQRTAALALQPPQGQAATPTAARVSGKTFQLSENELGFRSATFAFQDNGCVVTLRDASSEYPVRCGQQNWVRGETALPSTPPRIVSGGAPRRGTISKIATSGTWKSNDTFEIM